MTITPLAPRTPYIAVPAGSCTTSIDAISRGLMDLRLAPCAMSTGTSSTIHRGWLFDMKELTPWMRTERPPSAISVTVTPGKRSLKSCASDRLDRKSTRLNYQIISYAVFCLKKKKTQERNQCLRKYHGRR